MNYKHGHESRKPISTGWCERTWRECKACCTDAWPRCHDFYKGMCLMQGVLSCPFGWHPTYTQYSDLQRHHLASMEDHKGSPLAQGNKPKKSWSERPRAESSSIEAKPKAVRKKEKKHRGKSKSLHDHKTTKHGRKSVSESSSREKTKKR